MDELKQRLRTKWA